ncbi:MAG TPA: bifunctional pyr operon transcriptional regulator/uracil phosphoribosyltransferase PyrR [Candidatus Saccharimonadia bacterium]|nr:bifunctional pyr operon transcriptional regulator/uracil phosphoribosyltransferase PyrR [Candidatus Saccharimonadia bacterium]
MTHPGAGEERCPQGVLPEVEVLLDALAQRLSARLERARIDDPCVVGVQTGGVWLAQRLHAMLGLATPLGTLDISFHRDDFEAAGLNPVLHPSRLPWDVAGRDVVLVDDVLYTGRTVRAALNAIFDWGRPASISLVVLVARDGRELPLQADIAAAEIALEPGCTIKLRGPEPLRLELVRSGARAERPA